jgi:uncharacterized protein YndB with AHSA1/START domain
MKPGFEVFLNIQRPVADVFNAVYDPRQLEKYFTTGGASGPLEEGTTVLWDFADFPGKFPVYVRVSKLNKKIVLEWKAQDANYNTRVLFTFAKAGTGRTKVSIQESGWRKSARAVKASYGNCFGWTHMLCCMKAWLEHGISLRKNSFS